MIKLSQLALIGACSILVGCVNQNTVAQKQIKPVSSPCQKIDLLLQSYHHNFDAMKTTQIKSKSTQLWKAKYHLVGNNCQIWTLGTDEVTYSCRLDVESEEIAQSYYLKAKETTAKCLSDNWISAEEDRNHDSGQKTIFSSDTEKATISTHIVPTKTVFGEAWTVYYYIGAAK